MTYRRANGREEFYSRLGRGGVVELLVDADGMPTMVYPHVHIIHHSSGNVEVLPSFSKTLHGPKRELQHPSGQQVQAAIDKATEILEQVRAYVIRGAAGEEVGSVVFVPRRDIWVCFGITFNGEKLREFRYRQTGSDTFTKVEVGQTFPDLPPGGTYNKAPESSESPTPPDGAEAS